MNGESSEPKTDLQSHLAPIRKILALVVVTPWMEVVAMMAGATLVAILVVAAILVAIPATAIVLVIAIPVAAAVLAVVGLVKLAVKAPADDE